MSRVPQLPRSVMTWGLMLLTVIVGGVRPSCISANGTLCLLCPKLLAVSAVSSSAESSATVGSCSSHSCCCEQTATPTRSELTAAGEMAGSPCDGCDCLTVPAVTPATVQKVDDPTSRLDFDVAPAMFANAELSLSRKSSRLTGSTHRVGSPPDLFVLYQRWLI